MKIWYIFLSLCLLQLTVANAQNNPVTTATIQSKILNEPREILIYIPTGLNQKSQVYPVLYVFDAGSLFWPALGALKFMNYSSSVPQLPEAIIIGIKNTNRDRDMPVPQEIQNTTGAANFLQFISEELVPYINKNYPANGLNTLIGHSQGGLFVTYAGIKRPDLFPFILSLDAPVTVNPAVLKDYQAKIEASCTLNYFSGETLYGWGKDFRKPANCNSYSQKRIEEETHETMPYKGMYEGLKFLFREHIIPQTGLNLTAIKQYYSNLSQKHKCVYSVPSSVLLASATLKINQSKKAEAIELLQYYEAQYGAGTLSGNLLTKANSITKAPDSRIDYYLTHPGSSADELTPFLGKWKGVLKVPGGMDTDIVWEIKKINDRYIMESRIMNSFTQRSDFLLVTEKKELAWGRKHNSGGIYLSIGKLSPDGRTITGTEDLLGFEMPPGYPPFQINSFSFTKITN